MQLNEWTQIGPTWQRVYPCGRLAVCWRSQDDRWDSRLHGNGCGTISTGIQYLLEIERLKKELDEKLDPQPEVVERGPVWTLFKHGPRAAMVRMAKAFECGSWVTLCGDGTSRASGSRDEAEAAAKSYVMQSN